MKRGGTPYIYFIAPVGGGPIKIGCSNMPATRLHQLMEWAPVELEILAVAEGAISDERLIHQHFSSARMHNEWFEPTADIMALVADVRITGRLPAEFLAPAPKPKRVRIASEPRKEYWGKHWTQRDKIKLKQSAEKGSLTKRGLNAADRATRGTAVTKKFAVIALPHVGTS